MGTVLNRLSRLRSVYLAAAVAILAARSTATRIEGAVFDKDDNPLAGALVYLPGTDTATTGSEGRFVLGHQEAAVEAGAPARERAPGPRLIPARGRIVCENPTSAPLDIAVFTPGGAQVDGFALGPEQRRVVATPEGAPQLLLVCAGHGPGTRTRRVVLTAHGALMHRSRAGAAAAKFCNGPGKAAATACTVWVSRSGYVSKSFALACDTGGVKLVLSQTTAGGICEPCRRSVDCGQSGDLCIATGGSTGYCARACPEGSGCPEGYTCSRVNAGGTIVRQCLPDGGVCPGAFEQRSCANDQGCDEGEVCRDGRCVAEAHLVHCVELINQYRANRSRPRLSPSRELEEFAAEGAAYDAARNQGHAHFLAVQDYTLCDAENEIPGWPLSQHGSITAIIDAGTRMMWDEGPGGAHYDNMVGNHTVVGCGIFVTEDNRVWLIQDYR